MDLAIISDTHMPRGHRALPAACVERLRAADAILHAGDLVTLDVLALLETAADGAFAIFNPGSPTERRRAPAHTMGEAVVEDGRVTFSLIELAA